MPKTVIVNFSDGTSHTYDNVPDNIEDKTVEERAQKEFSDKEIQGLSEGILATPTHEPDWVTKALGSIHTVAEVAGQHPVVSTAVGFGAANLAGKIPGVGPALNTLGETFIPKYGMAKNLVQGAGNWAEGFANRNVGNQAQAMADLAHQARMGGAPLPNEMLHDTAQTLAGKMGQPGTVAPTGPAVPVQNLQQGVNNMIRGGAAPAAPAAPNMAPPVAPTGQNLMGRLGAQFAPLAQRVAPVLQGASKLVAPAAIASELFYTSPQEQAQLKQMEQSGTTLKDWTKQKLGIGQPQLNIDDAIRKAAAKRALEQGQQ